jgi:hypothetical protein
MDDFPVPRAPQSKVALAGNPFMNNSRLALNWLICLSTPINPSKD